MESTTQRPLSAELERLWSLYPGPLIGVRCGAISGISVLDIDSKHAIAHHWWAQNRSRLPATRTHRTRSGGVHLVFQYATGFPTTVGRIVRGVDTRSDGGFVIWWPAAGLRALHEGPIVAAPDFLIDALKPRQPQCRPPSGYVVVTSAIHTGLSHREALATAKSALGSRRDG